MYFIHLVCLFLLEYLNCFQVVEGWEYLNIQCRDDDREAVDWWYIYKPPSSEDPYMENGINYSYITPNNQIRWQPSPNPIYGSDSMLQFTLAPMFKEEYAEFIAVVDYEGRSPMGEFMGSAARGLVIANAMGGLWIGHTVPGFPYISRGIPMFPPEELKNGHMIMCLTLQLSTVNAIATAIKQTEPYIKKISIPENLYKYFRNWRILSSPLPTLPSPTVRKTKVLNFVTKGKTMRGIILARSPGDPRCLYKSFAESRKIVLDVYNHKEHEIVRCAREYGVRNIDSISLKFPQQVVYYIKNTSDSMGFGVSTVANWQRTGTGSTQFWTCTGDIEYHPVSFMGGLLACVSHSRVWQSFDNLKTKEPDCNKN